METDWRQIGKRFEKDLTQIRLTKVANRRKIGERLETDWRKIKDRLEKTSRKIGDRLEKE